MDGKQIGDSEKFMWGYLEYFLPQGLGQNPKSLYLEIAKCKGLNLSIILETCRAVALNLLVCQPFNIIPQYKYLCFPMVLGDPYDPQV